MLSICITLYRYVNGSGDNYNSTMSIIGPYGLTNTFTGPKVRIYYVFIARYVNNLACQFLCTLYHHYILILPFFQTAELAKFYYSCESIEGLSLENEGGSGTAR